MAPVPGKKHTRTILREYSKALLKRPWYFLLLFASVVGLEGFMLAEPLYFRQIFNGIASGTPSTETATRLFWILGILALLTIGEQCCRRLNSAMLIVIENRAMVDLTERVFTYVLGHSQGFFTSQFVGTLTRRVRHFYQAFETILETVMTQLFTTLLFVIGAVTILFLRSHILGIVLAVWVVLMVALQIWLTRIMQPLRKARSEADSKVSGALSDTISNHDTILLFSGIPLERSAFAKIIEAWRAASRRAWTADEMVWGTMGFFMGLIELLLIGLAIWLWEKGILTIGDFILIQLYLVTTFNNVVGINFTLRRFYSALADASETAELLDAPHDIIDLPDARPLAVSAGSITFAHVDFSFNEARTILKDYRLALRGGEKVALVGPSGAGKSTVTKLLLRLYDVTAGSICIDGQDIAQVAQESLRNAIGFVPQEPILFHRSLRENIRYGRPGASDEEVMAAAKKAHAHEFISGFPQGYDTLVGERGVKLSGGERQRVAIARAILKNAPILVLDEATSSLDSESEHYIQAALDTLMEGKTVVVIAHRLSTIMKMDRIVVMEQGRIVASGTHDVLLAEGGLYQKLWSIQAGGFLIEEGDDEPEEAEEPEEDEEEA